MSATYTPIGDGRLRYRLRDGVLLPGQTYRYTPGASEYAVRFDDQAYSLAETPAEFHAGLPIEFVWQGLAERAPADATVSPFTILATNVSGSAAQAVTGTLLSHIPSRERAVLVYDFVAAAQSVGNQAVPGGSNQGWTPMDTGPAMNTVEWAKIQVDGQERLLGLGADGWLNLFEESTIGDQLEDTEAASATGLRFEEIESYLKTRSHGGALEGLSKPVDWALAVATCRPRYSANVLFEGVNRFTALVTDKTRDRTKYLRPFGQADFDESNGNADFGNANREDYSCLIPPAGILLTGGINLALFQEYLHSLNSNGRQARSFQIEILNQQGRLRFLGLASSAREGRQRKGMLN